MNAYKFMVGPKIVIKNKYVMNNLSGESIKMTNLVYKIGYQN